LVALLVYGWAPDLILSTDTTTTTHDVRASVDGWFLATPFAFKLDLSGVIKFEQLPDLVAFGAVESLLVQQMSDQPMSRPVEDMVETELERLVNQKNENLVRLVSEDFVPGAGVPA
jgi:hypothetical protein